MNKVEPGELLSLSAYEEIRPHFMKRVVDAKKNRRVGLGDHMTFIFENHDTMLLQIQEMLRTERITNEAGIAHEIETYNELIPNEGELSATLMIEYDDQAERRVMLDKLAELRQTLFLKLGDEEAPATFFDQPGEEPDRLPAVNYVRFTLPSKIQGVSAREALLDAKLPVALESRASAYPCTREIPSAMRQQLAEDLR